MVPTVTMSLRVEDQSELKADTSEGDDQVVELGVILSISIPSSIIEHRNRGIARERADPQECRGIHAPGDLRNRQCKIVRPREFRDDIEASPVLADLNTEPRARCFDSESDITECGRA